MYSSAEGLLNQAKTPTDGGSIGGPHGVAGSCFDWKFPLSSQVDLEEAYEDDWTVWWPRDIGSNSTKNSQNTWVVVKVVITFFCF